MKYFTLLQKKLQKSDIETVAQALGYKSVQKAKKTLQRFLEVKDVYSWVHLGVYDFTHNAESFLEGVAKLCNVEYAKLKEELKQQQKFHNALENVGVLQAHTNFQRKNQSVLTLGAASREKYVPLQKEEFVFKTKQETIEFLQKYIQQHYKKTKGEIPVFGKIEYYTYRFFEGEELRFNINGELL